jgi:hypothetical protein
MFSPFKLAEVQMFLDRHPEKTATFSIKLTHHIVFRFVPVSRPSCVRQCWPRLKTSHALGRSIATPNA